MAKSKQRDNSTYTQKVLIRQQMIKRMAAAGVAPVLMETHGGYGKLYAACYGDIARGIVFDTDADKASRLAFQRPTWAVYEADCEAALSLGAGAHLTINALDIDAYGDSHTPFKCFIESDRPHADKLWIVANDGLRQNARLGDAWSVGILQEAVAHFGNQIDSIYLDVCRWIVERQAAKAGYRLINFGGWFTGDKKQVTHYMAELVKR